MSTILGQYANVMNGAYHAQVLMSPAEIALRDGRAFTGSTSMVPVSVGNQLYAKLFNPADSGIAIFAYFRIFSNSQSSGSAETLVWQAFGNPSATLANQLPGVNLRLGNPSAGDRISYEVADDTFVFGGVAGSTDVLYPNLGSQRPIQAMVEPGDAIGIVISGAGSGGNLENAAQIGVTFDWYEEPYTP